MANIQHSITVTANTSQAKASLQDLQNQLHSLASVPVGVDATGLQSAKTAILELGQNLRTAMNPNTGKLDLSVFSRALKDSNKSILDYKNALFSMGTQGQQAFLSLSNAIASAEAPTNRLNQKIINFGKTLKNTINWQISSSLVHGVVGQVQQVINYAEKLNTSLNNIQIITGQNNEKMAEFARQANKAAKQLSTSTTEYTNASLIYYQQGLNDKEVAARTETTLKMANVTRQSAQLVSDQMTAIWNNYAEGSSNLEHYADVITALGAATASSSAEIAGGLEKFAAISKTVGLSYDYATTALATIVATTRQSEDTVGTGLRTLFSRLEGLSLGETLEDGVNLNKYSSALAKVGVNIMDQYGKIKDMDNILDELGAKWGTISKEQQIALAQTVGGVRQYTNLIALMDNWQFFQKNLQVAQNADGTLQTQAERYATSWEAARKRVQTSAEGIYDSLIDDQAIIKVTNVFAGFLDVINGLVAGFGGLKGIIPIVGSLLLNSFAKNMPQFLNDIGNNFRVLTGRAQKDMTGMQETLGATLMTLRDNTTDPVYRAQIQKTIDTNYMNRSLAMNANRMSEADQAAYKFKIAQRELENDSIIMAAQEKQKNEQQYKQLLENQRPNTIKELSKFAEAKSQRGTLTASKNAYDKALQTARAEYSKAQLALNLRKSETNYKNLENEIQARQEMLRDSSLTAQRRNEITKELRNLQKTERDYVTREELALKDAKTNFTTAKKNYDEASQNYQANENIITKGEEKGVLANQLLAKNGVDVKALLKQYDIQDRNKLSNQMITEETLRQYRSGGILTTNDREILAQINAGYYKELKSNQYTQGFLKAGSAKLNAFAQESKDLFDPTAQKIDKQAFMQKANDFAESWQNAVNQSNLSDKIKQSLQITPDALMPDQQAFNGSFDQFSSMLETKLNSLKVNIQNNLKTLGIEETQINDILTKLGLGPNIENIAQNAYNNGGLDFQRGYRPSTSNKPEDAKPTQTLSTTLTQTASAAMSLYSAFQSASNAVQSFSEDTTTGLSKFGSVLSGITSTLMSAGIAGNAVKGIGGTFGGTFGAGLSTIAPYIGIALALGTALWGIFSGKEETRKKQEEKISQEIYEKADDSYERLTQSAELNHSQENLINAYNQTAEDLKRGQAIQKALEEAQQALIESLNTTTDAGYTNNNAIGAALAGNMAETQHIIDENRKKQLAAERQYAQTAQQRAINNLQFAETNNAIWDSSENRYILGRGAFETQIDQASIKLLDLYADSFKKLSTITITGNKDYKYASFSELNTPQDFVEYYQDLQQWKKLIEDSGIDTSTNNGFYTTIKSQLTALAPQIEMYLKYAKQIEESDLEYLMLGGTTDKGKSINIDNQIAVAANNYIKDLDSYEKYRNSLIEVMTEGLVIGTKEYNEEIAKIDAALGTLPSVANYQDGNLQYISKGVQSIVDNQIKYQSEEYDLEDEDFIKQSVKKLYDKYKDAIFDWNYTIKIPLGFDFQYLENFTDDPLFIAQLKAIEAKAQANKVKIAIDATAEFNLDINSTYAEMADFVKKMNASLNINDEDAAGAWQTYSANHEKLIAADFFALPKEQREALVREVNRNAVQDYYKPGGALSKEAATAVVLSAQLAERAQTVSKTYNEQYAGQRRVRDYGSYSDIDIIKRESLLSQYFATDATAADQASILAILTNEKSSDADKTIAKDLEAGNTAFIEGLLKAKDLLNEASLAAENQSVKVAELNAEWEAYGATAFRNQLIDQAEAWGINYDEVQQYATQLRELRFFKKDVDTEEYQEELALIQGSLEDIQYAYTEGRITEEEYIQRQQELTQDLLDLNDAYNADIRASEELALIQIRLEKGVEVLSSNWSTWKKTLKDAIKNTWAQNSAFLALRKALANILNQDPEKISEDFIDVADSFGLIDEAAKGTKEGTEALQKFAFQAAALDSDLFQYNNLTEFETAFNETFSELSDSFNTFAESVKDTEVGMPIIDTTGFISSFTQAQLLAGKSLDSIKAMFAGFGVNLDAEWVPITSPEQVKEFQGIVGTSSVDENGAITITYSPGGVSEAQISEGIAYGLRIGNNATKTGGGGSGGKGGGGGGKKEPHKIKRYRNITNQIQNNDRKTQSVSRNKDRAFGTAKLDLLKQERDLHEENLKLQQQYQSEIEDWLDKDKDKMMEAFAAINFTPIFDEAGEVINNDEFEAAFEAIGDGSDEAWKKAEEALAQYEETLDLLNDKLEEIQELQDAIYDAALEATKLKSDLQLDVSVDRFEYLDYLLDKIDDDAYQTAEAIALLGDKTAETMKKINTYTTGLEDILSRHGFSLSDLDNLSVEDLNAAGFTQSEIDQIKEWRSELLKANQDLLEMRKTIIDKVVSAFDDLNDKITKEVDNFDVFNSVLENYKNISNLLGNKLGPQQQAVIEKLNASMITNARNRIKATKDILDDAQAAEQQAQAQYAEAMKNWANLSDDNRRRAEEDWKKILEAAHDNVEEATQQWLEAWEGGLELAQDLFEETMEKLVTDYNKAMGGTFGNLDYLQEAYERQKDVSNQYVQDYEKLHQLSQLSRDISKSIDDTDSIKSKERLRTLQKEINDLQMSNTKMSEYELQVLRKRFELEQARLNLGEAKNSKSQVRLQRDNEGNWGYVYTADEDKVAEAEEEYENKLYEYQKLNHEYITQLQDDMTNLFGEYRDAVANILNDLTLSPEEVQANIEQIMGTLEDKLPYLYEQLQAGFTNQESLQQLFIDTYGNEGAQMVDTWGETILSMFSEGDSLEDFINKFRNQLQTLVTEGMTARQNLETIQNGMNDDAEVSTTDFADHISDVTINIDSLSGDTLDTIEVLTDVLNTEFSSALAKAVNWELQYVNAMDAMINRNENFVKSLNLMIEKLAGVNIDTTEMLQPLETLDNLIEQSTTPVYYQNNLSKLTGTSTEHILALLNANIAAYGTGLGELSMSGINGLSTTIDQNVQITASFPNATNHSEIEEAFTNLINKASQYANRKGL